MEHTNCPNCNPDGVYVELCKLHRAAPALLEALEELLDHVEQLDRGHSPGLLSLKRIPMARAAIEAAK